MSVIVYRGEEMQTIHPDHLDYALKDGWTTQKLNATKKEKPKKKDIPIEKAIEKAIHEQPD